ncbi:hypothetical protein ACIO3O_36825 [Streptomyces sp. NPDC087440]|uniref:hypothetical protein n=1 Tax=Streptomyces sp. NPDC087440 TaxID=3365790 RepID=UPI0037F24D29
MSTALVLAPKDTTALEAVVALIACGAREGKTAACRAHAAKGHGLLRIARTGALDALAAAICGAVRGGSCADCVAKAEQIHLAVEEEVR